MTQNKFDLTKFTKSDSNTEQLMSSDEIAILTGKEKFHIARDIQAMISKVDYPNLDNSDYQIVTENYEYNGRTCTRYWMNQLACLLLVSGYNIELRKKVIDRWFELEKEKRQALNNQLPKDYLGALKALVKAEEEKQQLIDHVIEQDEVIDDLTHKIPLAEVRQRLNQLVRKGNDNDNAFCGQWSFLYKEFNLLKHMNVQQRARSANMSVLDYIEKNGMMYELFDLACKLYHRSYEKLMKEWGQKVKEFQR